MGKSYEKCPFRIENHQTGWPVLVSTPRLHFRCGLVSGLRSFYKMDKIIMIPYWFKLISAKHEN